MAEVEDAPIPPEVKRERDLSNIATDLDSLITLVQSMHEEVTAFFQAAKTPFWESAQAFDASFYFCIGEMHTRVTKLNEVASAMEEMRFARKVGHEGRVN